MYLKIIGKDLVNKRAVSLITILFIAAASMLLSLAAILTVNLSGAVEKLMLDAKTPHFMQMHSGELRLPELNAFVEEQPNIDAFQVLDFLNLDNSQIILGEHSLAGSVQDNGVCVQSSQFDFLLDLDNQPVKPKKGELYVPVCYFKDGTVRAGDKASLCGQPLIVAGFVRDSQMNSALASSKRFVVGEADYSSLKAFGNVEYLIEFRLRDQSELGAFETAYAMAGLPSNGPALTWPLFQLISAVSDGILIAVLVLISAAVIFIAFLCVRFTLLAKIEDDYREIGVMKALGIRVFDIQRIYLSIYAALAAIGSGLGFLLALWLQKPLLKNIRLNLGGGENSVSALAAGTAGALLVFFIILFYINWNLRRFRSIPAAQAIRFGVEEAPFCGARGIRLADCGAFPINFLLGIKDVLERKRLYTTMLTVVILASFIMIVPQNLYHTISSDDFVTYMGVGGCDLRMDIQQTIQIDEKTAEIGESMKSDREIKSYALFTTKVFPVSLENGVTENLKVELGNHAAFPLQYTEGRMPTEEHEIALSAMSAEELRTGVGGTITLNTSSGERPLTVCGIYSDITNGGKTAKATFTDPATVASWGFVCADLTDKGLLDRKISEYSRRFPYAKISGIGEYMAQTFGQTLQSVRAASLAAGLVASVVILLVTLLFIKLLVAKDRHPIAVLRAVGFTGSDICRQYAWRAALVTSTGIFAGTVLAGTLGEKLAAVAISSFGAAAFHFTVSPLNTYLLSPLILLLFSMLAVILGTSRAGNIKHYESIKE